MGAIRFQGSIVFVRKPLAQTHLPCHDTAQMLREGLKALAHRLQEAMDALSSQDVRARLQDALDDQFAGKYPWLVDYFGDSASGDCVYCVSGEYARAPYEISSAAGASKATIGNASPVQPRTVYDPVPDDADFVAAMEALEPAEKPLSKIPGVLRMLYERFIPKSERDNASSSDFAGKGKSFPILKPEDIDAAFRSIGRAGAGNYSAAVIKANIVKIANRKGWSSHLPKSAQAATSEAADIQIDNEFVSLRESSVAQDGSTLLKLIAPGKGSSGWYSEGVLRTAASNRVFRAGTKNFWNHQTAAEESARPEGNLDDLASVLTEDAYYAEGPKGPGLYAKAKVYEHYRKPIDDMAKDIGVSIRAQGKAREGQLPDGSRGPVIEELTRAISADYVTTPGAGGQVVSLFESKRGEAVRLRESSTQGDKEMDEAQVKKLIEADRATLTAQFEEKLKPLQAENLKLRGRVQVTEAAAEVTKILGGLSLHQGVRDRVKARVLAGTLPVIEATGELDIPKLKTLVEADAKEEAEYLGKLIEGQGRIVGMGPVDPTTTVDLKEDEYFKQMVESHMREGMTKPQAEIAARGRAA